VRIGLHLENVTSRTLDLYLRGREITFDVTVRGENGRTVWRRLEDEVVPAILRLEPLPGGGALDLETLWDQRSGEGEQVPAGRYTLEAELLTEDGTLRWPVASLRITAR
jgi:hypothetical protein